MTVCDAGEQAKAYLELPQKDISLKHINMGQTGLALGTAAMYLSFLASNRVRRLHEQ